MGSTSAGQETEQSEGKTQARAFLVFSMGKARQGRRNSSGLAGVNNSGRLLGRGVVCSCLIPGPGLTWGRGNTDLVCEG